MSDNIWTCPECSGLAGSHKDNCRHANLDLIGYLCPRTKKVPGDSVRLATEEFLKLFERYRAALERIANDIDSNVWGEWAQEALDAHDEV